MARIPFSKRTRLQPMTKEIQLRTIDEALRNRLWNCLHACYWSRFNSHGVWESVHNSNLGQLFTAYWNRFFKLPYDQMPGEFDEAKQEVRQFFFACQWNEVYDLIEFTLAEGPKEFAERFATCCNSALAGENAGYRLLDGQITPITDEHELLAVDSALTDTEPLSGVHEHLRSALKHMSDRRAPDLRNSVKESICAVEATCQLLAGKEGASLNEALAVLERGKGLHPALKKSFSALYGYTSAAGGIRHAMLEEPSLTFVDAKYMLAACAAFVSYLLGKRVEKGASDRGA